MQNSSFKASNTSFKVLVTAAAIGMFVVAGSAQAKSLGRPCTTVPESQWLSLQELQQKIGALGYNVRKAKLSKGCAEFYIRDNIGEKIELFVDPSNGHIVEQILEHKR